MEHQEVTSWNRGMIVRMGMLAIPYFLEVKGGMKVVGGVI